MLPKTIRAMRQDAKKILAESQGLRGAFQDLLGGTYAPEEMERDNMTIIDGDTGKPLNKSQSLMKKITDAKEKAIEESQETGELCTPEQIEEIQALITVKGFSSERMNQALEYYNVENLIQITSSQAVHFIGVLNREEDK